VTSRPAFAVGLAPIALWLAACQPAAAPAAGLSAADRQTIDSLHGAFSAAAMANDYTKVSSMYTEDASLLATNSPVASGRIAIKEAFGHFPPVGDMKLTTDEAHGTADMAAIRGTYVILFAPPGQPAFSDSGKFVELWRKQADGNWLIVWDIFNTSIATPPITSAH
jgi:uncharacterized protein (TIGR02246 family)